jgi:hypothetical protein
LKTEGVIFGWAICPRYGGQLKNKNGKKPENCRYKTGFILMKTITYKVLYLPESLDQVLCHRSCAMHSIVCMSQTPLEPETQLFSRYETGMGRIIQCGQVSTMVKAVAGAGIIDPPDRTTYDG